MEANHTKTNSRKHNLNKTREKEYFYYVFLDTDKGLLLVPLDKVVNPKNL